MASIPAHSPTLALQLALQLTPIQRHVLARAGMPRWLGLSDPWQPLPGRQQAVARALASAEYALLSPVSTYLGAYQLTPLGELVAGVLLLRGLALG